MWAQITAHLMRGLNMLMTPNFVLNENSEMLFHLLLRLNWGCESTFDLSLVYPTDYILTSFSVAQLLFELVGHGNPGPTMKLPLTLTFAYVTLELTL